MFRDIQSIPSFVELQCSAEEVLFVLSLAKERRDGPVVRRLRHMLSSSAVKARGFSRKASRYGAIAPCFLTETRNQCAVLCHAAAAGRVLSCARGACANFARGGGKQRGRDTKNPPNGDGRFGGFVWERAISGCRSWRGGCRSRLCRG